MMYRNSGSDHDKRCRRSNSGRVIFAADFASETRLGVFFVIVNRTPASGLQYVILFRLRRQLLILIPRLHDKAGSTSAPRDSKREHALCYI